MSDMGLAQWYVLQSAGVNAGVTSDSSGSDSHICPMPFGCLPPGLPPCRMGGSASKSACLLQNSPPPRHYTKLDPPGTPLSFFGRQSSRLMHTGKPPGVAVSHCITWFQTQLIHTTCQIRYPVIGGIMVEQL